MLYILPVAHDCVDIATLGSKNIEKRKNTVRAENSTWRILSLVGLGILTKDGSAPTDRTCSRTITKSWKLFEVVRQIMRRLCTKATGKGKIRRLLDLATDLISGFSSQYH
jgi:hypothetical protein